MTKQELAQQVASDTGLGAWNSRDVVDAAFAAITAELVAGGDVAIAGLASSPSASTPRARGRNPRPARRFGAPSRRGPRRGPTSRASTPGFYLRKPTPDYQSHGRHSIAKGVAPLRRYPSLAAAARRKRRLASWRERSSFGCQPRPG